MTTDHDPLQRLTIDDLEPGKVMTALYQGTAITPQARQIKIHHVAPDRIHYQVLHGADSTAPAWSPVKETSIERFLAIVNQSVGEQSRGYDQDRG
jgi:hypothetical protein